MAYKALCLHDPSRREHNGQVCDLQPHPDAPQEHKRFHVKVQKDKTNLSPNGEKWITYPWAGSKFRDYNREQRCKLQDSVRQKENQGRINLKTGMRGTAPINEQDMLLLSFIKSFAQCNSKGIPTAQQPAISWKRANRLPFFPRQKPASLD